jgi:hypothetical protein
MGITNYLSTPPHHHGLDFDGGLRQATSIVESSRIRDNPLPSECSLPFGRALNAAHGHELAERRAGHLPHTVNEDGITTVMSEHRPAIY